MSSLNRVPFKYKNWCWYLLFMSNTITPGLLCLQRLNKDINTVNGSWFNYIFLVIFSIFIIFLFIYTFFSLRELNVCFPLLKKKKNREFKRLLLGIGLAMGAVNTALIYSIATVFAAEGTTLKVFGYIFVAISFFLGLASNIFIKLFEFKINFYIFHRKHKDDLFKPHFAKQKMGSPNVNMRR